ncbi:MAG: hypothetical protein KDB22_02530 [Planctomycetales bacterium]|nr:hypothetical protein [Planctomycetales bacterium]
MTTHNCPSLKHLAMLAKGTLAPDACEILLSHVRGCPECQAAFRTLRAVELQTNPQVPHAQSAQAAPKTQPPAEKLEPRASERPLQPKIQNEPRPDGRPLVKAVQVHPEKPSSPVPSPQTKRPTPAQQARATRTQPSQSKGAATPRGAPPGESTNKRKFWPFALAAASAATLGLVVVGVSIGYFAYLRPPSGGTPSNPSSPEVANSSTATSTMPNAGFAFGEIKPTELIQTLRVTIELGSDGEMLSEPVDLHLGLGYPLRLHPLGESSEEGFAAISQQSSLKSDERWIASGESAWFEFSSGGRPSARDPLGKTPALLSGTKVGDITRLGIASRGESRWQLKGYKIEINGALFAKNDLVNLGPRQVLDEDAELVDELAAQREALTKSIQEYEVLDEAGYLSDQDREDWEQAKQQLSMIDEPLESATGRLLGKLPWFEEIDNAFSERMAHDWIQDPVEVTLITSSEQGSGTANPFYLVAGSKKYLLSSPISPLKDGPARQSYVLSSLELRQDPISNQDLASIGIGMVAGDHRFAKAPDKAKLDRVVVSTAAGPVFDSELQEVDRNALHFISFIPPAHRDDIGKVVAAQPQANLRSSWKFGQPAELQSTLSPGSSTLPDSSGSYEPENIEPNVALPIDPVSVWPVANSRKLDNSTMNSVSPSAVSNPAILASDDEGLRNAERLTQLRNFPVRTSIISSQVPGRAKAPSFASTARRPLMQLLLGMLLRANGANSRRPNFGSAPGLGTAGTRIPGTGIPGTGIPGTGIPGIGISGTGRNPMWPNPGGSNPGGSNPGGSNPGGSNPGGGTRVPVTSPPSLLQISDVAVEHADQLEVGKAVVVRWREQNATNVAQYEVRLNAVLPHKSLAKRTFLVSHKIARIAKTESATLPEIKLDAKKLGLSTEELRHIFVEPEVLAWDARGKLLSSGPSPTGPLAVLHPAGWSKLNLDLQLGPAPTIDPKGWITLENPDSKIPGFQLGGDGYGHWGDKANQWLPFAAVTSSNTVSSAATKVPMQGAWRLRDSQDTDSGLLLAGYPTNVGVRSGQNYVTLRFDAYPIQFQQDMRLCGLVGVINGSPKEPVKNVAFNMRVLVRHADPASPPQNQTDPQDMLRLVTPAEAPIAKHDSSGAMAPLGLIDVPIQVTANASTYANSIQKAVPKLEIDTSVPYKMRKVSPVLVSVTLMIDARGLSRNDAIGVFGMRLVPE